MKQITPLLTRVQDALEYGQELERVAIESERHYHTQGGGTARYDTGAKQYIFVCPPLWGDFQTGDIVPSEWGIV